MCGFASKEWFSFKHLKLVVNLIIFIMMKIISSVKWYKINIEGNKKISQTQSGILMIGKVPVNY